MRLHAVCVCLSISVIFVASASAMTELGVTRSDWNQSIDYSKLAYILRSKERVIHTADADATNLSSFVASDGVRELSRLQSATVCENLEQFEPFIIDRIVQGGPKQSGHKLMAIILSDLNRFSKFFAGRFLGKFAISCLLKCPPLFAYVATLPHERIDPGLRQSLVGPA